MLPPKDRGPCFRTKQGPFLFLVMRGERAVRMCLPERIVPAQAGEAGEVTIVGVDDRAVFYGSCGKHCICHESPADMHFAA